jgi:hypothetical protein
MAYEMDVLDISLKAAGDLSSYQYCFVKLTADNTVDVCGADEQAIGILQNKPSVAGQAARVRVFGVSRFVNGTAGAIAYNAKVKSAASGKGVAATLATEIYFGVVLQGTSAVNQLGTMLITGVMTLSV